MLALVLLSFTESGQALFRRNEVGGDNVGWSMVYRIVLFLTSLGWMHSDIPKEEIDPSRTFLGEIIQDIKDFFNRTDGQGWDVPKLRAYLHTGKNLCVADFTIEKLQSLIHRWSRI